MSVEQKRRISNEQYDDMRLRYGTKSPVLSSLIIAKDEEGTIVGCVGLEQAIVGPSALSHHPSFPLYSLPEKVPCSPVHVASPSPICGFSGHTSL
jgi:hypothetical protein